MDWFEQGGAAFPIPHSNEAGAPGSEHGMSLRDWFAGQAMQMLIHTCRGDNRGISYSAYVAQGAYEFADAMLAERAK